MTSSLEDRWARLDNEVASWWDGDMRTAYESDITAAGPDWTWQSTIKAIGGVDRDPPTEPTLLYLPFPFSPAAGNQGAFPEMYAWDSYFIIRGFLAHERYDLARAAILNQLFMILRYGKVLNGNRTYLSSRSQAPLHPDALWRYYEATNDKHLLMLAYPMLVAEYTNYWNNGEHATPTGLCTASDTHDPYLRSPLASEAETGLDFTPIYDGDVENHVPIALNCQLVAYARTLSRIATVLEMEPEAGAWLDDAERRSALIRLLCWDEQSQFFREYNYKTQRRSHFVSLSAFWTLWAGVATQSQADAVVVGLSMFQHDGWLTFTDKAYASPFPEFETLQWAYPYCWPPLIVIVVDSLSAYGKDADAIECGRSYLANVISRYDRTGQLWEKYMVDDDEAEVPERYETASFHGWTAASVAVIGRHIGFRSARTE